MFKSVLHRGQQTLAFEESGAGGCCCCWAWARGPCCAGWGPEALTAPGPGPEGAPGLGVGFEGCCWGWVVSDMRVLAWLRREAPKPNSFPKVCSGGGGCREGELPALRVWSWRWFWGWWAGELRDRSGWDGALAMPGRGTAPGGSFACCWPGPEGPGFLAGTGIGWACVWGCGCGCGRDGACVWRAVWAEGLGWISGFAEWEGECICCWLLERGVVMSIPNALCIWQLRHNHSWTCETNITKNTHFKYKKIIYISMFVYHHIAHFPTNSNPAVVFLFSRCGSLYVLEFLFVQCMLGCHPDCFDWGRTVHRKGVNERITVNDLSAVTNFMRLDASSQTFITVQMLFIHPFIQTNK